MVHIRRTRYAKKGFRLLCVCVWAPDHDGIRATGAKSKESPSRKWKHKINIWTTPKIAYNVCGQYLDSKYNLESHMKTNGHMKTNSININATRAQGKESGRNWKHNPHYYSAQEIRCNSSLKLLHKNPTWRNDHTLAYKYNWLAIKCLWSAPQTARLNGWSKSDWFSAIWKRTYLASQALLAPQISILRHR